MSGLRIGRVIAVATALVVVATSAGMAGAWLHSRAAPPAAESLHDRLHRTLELAPDQDARLHAIERAFASEKARLEAEMRAANRELADAITAGKSYTPEVQAAIDHFHMAMGALQKATVEHVFDMRAILTPEQQTTFDAEVRAALLAAGSKAEASDGAATERAHAPSAN
jgi:Spy/CpxP family protein refolding chaperone